MGCGSNWNAGGVGAARSSQARHCCTSLWPHGCRCEREHPRPGLGTAIPAARPACERGGLERGETAAPPSCSQDRLTPVTDRLARVWQSPFVHVPSLVRPAGSPAGGLRQAPPLCPLCVSFSGTHRRATGVSYCGGRHRTRSCEQEVRRRRSRGTSVSPEFTNRRRQPGTL